MKYLIGYDKTDPQYIEDYAQKLIGKTFADEIVEMPLNKRRFMMGNALVVNLVKDMEETLETIFDNE